VILAHVRPLRPWLSILALSIWCDSDAVRRRPPACSNAQWCGARGSGKYKLTISIPVWFHHYHCVHCIMELTTGYNVGIIL